MHITTALAPEGRSAAFVWELPANPISPKLMRPEGSSIFFEGAVVVPAGLAAWALNVFDLADVATPIGIVASPHMTATDGAGDKHALAPSERPFYFQLEPAQVSAGRLGLWLAGEGPAGHLSIVLRVLDHDPGFMYVGAVALREPPAAHVAAFLARIGEPPTMLQARAHFAAWDLELMLESDGFPDHAVLRTPGVQGGRKGVGPAEVLAYGAQVPPRGGWADAMAGIVRVAGLQRWTVDATVQGRSDRVEQVAPFTAKPEEWLFVRASHQGDGGTSLATASTVATFPGVRRGTFLLWSASGTAEAAFGMPFASHEARMVGPGYAQGLGFDGALRVFSPDGPVLALPDAGRGLGVEVPVADGEQEARAADRPDLDGRSVAIHEETVKLHLRREVYVQNGRTGGDNDNCVTIDLADSRLLGVDATATWTPTGANPTTLSLVATTEPYLGFDVVHGASPLTLGFAGGEIARASAVRVGVQRLDTDREAVTVAVVVDQEITVHLRMRYQGSQPTLGASLSSCGTVWR